MKRLFLGVDVSTTGVKALLVDGAGKVAASATTPLTLETPRPLWSEQDPQAWWAGATASIRAALAAAPAAGKDVAAVGLTGQMHGLVLLDEAERVLRPAILWNDQRTQAECEEIRSRMGGRAALVEVTGNDALTGFTAPKILWVRKHEPAVYARVRLVLLPKDYVRLRLSGEAAMDKADGSGTLLFDLAARAWSPRVLDRLEIPAAWLPRTFEGPEVTGRVTRKAAGETGLLEGTPVMAGGGDQSAGAVGAGAVKPGVVALTLGTSGVVFATTPRALVEPEGRLHALCHAVPGRWHFMGVTLSAAGSLQWYRDTLAPGTAFETLVQEAEAAPAGSDGLVFLPYLSGERTPYPDPLARGSFVGLTLRHRRSHLTRCILEGVAFSMRDCFELLKGAGLAEVRQVRVAGGGARSSLWRRIMASVLGVELVTVNSSEGAAYGAALLAGVGAENWPSVDAACEAVIAISGRDEPEPAWAGAYEELYPRFRELYPALSPTFARLGA
ncbi:MAG TPA: xylulokinase [Vicinamibacteria bacterium]|nr:xylulokinase [Vicinamibacteria bacterium]